MLLMPASKIYLCLMVHTATNRGSSVSPQKSYMAFSASTRTLRIFFSIISNITFTKSYVNLLSICKGKTDSDSGASTPN